ncbi:MAG: hypothetical protein QW332_01965 [Thermoproteota archaeon]
MLHTVLGRWVESTLVIRYRNSSNDRETVRVGGMPSERVESE